MFCLDRINLHQIEINILRQALFISIVSCMISSIAAAQKQCIYKEKIIGSWIERDSEDGSEKWIFKTNMTTEVYSEGELFTRYQKYEIVRTSEECGHTTNYDDIHILKLEENALTSNHKYRIENVGPVVYDCFYINGLDDEMLSLSYTKKGGPPLILMKEDQPTPNRN